MVTLTAVTWSCAGRVPPSGWPDKVHTGAVNGNPSLKCLRLHIWYIQCVFTPIAGSFDECGNRHTAIHSHDVPTALSDLLNPGVNSRPSGTVNGFATITIWISDKETIICGDSLCGSARSLSTTSLCCLSDSLAKFPGRGAVNQGSFTLGCSVYPGR